MSDSRRDDTRERKAPLDIDGEEFRRLGHQLVDRIGEFIDSLPNRPVTPGETPKIVRDAMGTDHLPEQGMAADELLDQTASLLFDHSLFNGHPKFWGYITSSASPIGALGDMLAASVNPNCGGWLLSPAASEIERQTVQWLAEFIGYPTDCGGLLVSGGNMANFVAFLAARQEKATFDIRAEGLSANPKQFVVYGSTETHTWIQKAADLFGLGTDSVRLIDTDADQRMRVDLLEQQIKKDRDDGYQPLLVVGAAGTVATGAIDPLPSIAAVCRKHDLWFHVDGAYGAPAAALADASSDLKGLAEADSIALDPHKWLYSPLEAGCTLVRNPAHLVEAFRYRPKYYHFEGEQADPPINFFEMGPQNSRGFRALKVWMGLRAVGREGCVQMIEDDIALARALYRAADSHPEMQVFTNSLSITTFRYRPLSLPMGTDAEAYLNELNEKLLSALQTGGEAFVSNAVVDGKYLLRACVVNFRTTIDDVEALPAVVARIGRGLDQEMRLRLHDK